MIAQSDGMIEEYASRPAPIDWARRERIHQQTIDEYDMPQIERLAIETPATWRQRHRPIVERLLSLADEVLQQTGPLNDQLLDDIYHASRVMREQWGIAS